MLICFLSILNGGPAHSVMVFRAFYIRENPKYKESNMEGGGQLQKEWDNVVCPICLDFPHNGVLLQCSSYEKGCRPFVCDTDHLHSNCLDRFRSAYSSNVSNTSASETNLVPNTFSVAVEGDSRPVCPLCRGEVIGWLVIDEARLYLDRKKRCCEEVQCAFAGTFMELKKHAQIEHPHAQPSKIDPARQLDWENFQQSSEIIDVLSTIHSEVPRGVVLGDYVIEYGENDTGDDFEDFPRDRGGNWWRRSCILYPVFHKFRNRRRSRVGNARRGIRHTDNYNSNSDGSFVASVEFPDYTVAEIDEEIVTSNSPSGGSSIHRSYRTHRSRFHHN